MDMFSANGKNAGRRRQIVTGNAPPGKKGRDEVANELQDRFEMIVATPDWHPADRGRFATNHPGSIRFTVAAFQQVV
jgi:hypothetical protein